MIYQQMSIFDDVIERYKITKPIRLIEFFSGIGSQAKSLQVIGANFEHYKTCEWAYNSYCAYNYIHIKDNTDYSKDLSKEELVKGVFGTSMNYNDSLTLEQLNKKSIEWLRNAYNNIKATHNLVNIMNVKGKDLEIVDTDKYEYILSYSFPCQDLSMAGKRAGMSVSQADGGTRSGLLWEVERILQECKDINQLPQILLMENVPEICGKKNVRDFEKWQMRLNELGYTNYCEILNGKDYGIPQNRRRCFMISILGNYNYTFPKKIQLRYRLKDLLEKDVDEKYFLSQKFLNYVTHNSSEKYNRAERFEESLKQTNEKGLATSLTTRQGRGALDNYIYGSKALNETLDKNEIKDGDFIDSYNRAVKSDVSPTITTRVDASNNSFVAQQVGYIEKGTGKHQSNTVYDGENIAPTLAASDYKEPVKILTIGNYGNGHHSQDITSEEGLMPTLTTGNHNNGQVIAIKNNNSKGYEFAEDGDGVNISTRMHHQRGNVQHGSAQTITCQGGNNVGVVVQTLAQELCDKLVEEGKVTEGDIVKHSFTNQILSGKKKAVEKQGEMITLTTRGDTFGVTVNTEREKETNLRIRKLTPLECMKLMGFAKTDYESMKAINMSDASIYHCAGDSIIVCVLCGIFNNLIGELNSHEKIINDYIEKEIL